MSAHRASAISLVAALNVSLAACAGVEVRKVPSVAQYEGTSAEKNARQADGDKILGARYYLPRPFVVVKQEFPVTADTFIVQGTIDADGNIQIDPKTLPPTLRHLTALRAEDVHDVRSDAQGFTAQSQAESAPKGGGGAGAAGDGAGSKTKTTKPAITLIADAKDSLAGSTVNHTLVPSKDATIELTLKIKKSAVDGTDPAIGGAAQLNTKKVLLVPFVDGAATTDVVEISGTDILSVDGTAGQDQVIVAQVVGSKVPALAGLGVALSVQGKDSSGAPATKDVVLHTKAPVLFSSFASATKPGSGAAGGDDKPKNESETNQSQTKTLSKAGLVTSGDPQTDPLIKVTDLFDIILLPDLDEQYAVKIKGGLGVASADMGLENGWMVERFKTDIDNHELGTFVTSMAEKLVDFGLSRVKPLAAAASAAGAAPKADASELKAQSQAGDKSVSVRIDRVGYAVPGIYPILKAIEQPEAMRKDGMAAPVVHYGTRDEITISLVGKGGAAPGAAAGTPATALSADDAQIVKVATDVNTYANVKGLADVLKAAPPCKAEIRRPQLPATSAVLLVSLRATPAQVAAVGKFATEGLAEIKKALGDKGTTLATLTFNGTCGTN